METLLTKISNSRNPLLENLFGLRTIRHHYDPKVNASILQRVERKIFGLRGLAGYEEEARSERGRLARRSLAQYLCQRALIRHRLVAWLQSLIFWIALLPLFLYLLLRSLADRSGSRREDVEVVIFGHFEEFRRVVQPLYLEKRLAYCTAKPVRLGGRELVFFLRVIADYPRVLLHPGFLINALRWLSYYGYITHHYKPQALVNFFEGTSSSSLMTAYLHEQGIKHINQMHGERFPFAGHSFCEFDEFNVWGEYFKELFMQQRCPSDRFVITGNPYHRFLFRKIRYAQQPRPERLLIIHNQLLSPSSSYYASLLRVLKQLDSRWEVRMRLHYNEVAHGLACLSALQKDRTLLERGLHIELEDHHSISLEDALIRSRVIVGASSTAMLEGWVAGCRVIHLKGDLNRDVLMSRYGGSANVLYEGDHVDIEGFLTSPAELNAQEDQLVNRVTRVLV